MRNGKRLTIYVWVLYVQRVIETEEEKWKKKMEKEFRLLKRAKRDAFIPNEKSNALTENYRTMPHRYKFITDEKYYSEWERESESQRKNTLSRFRIFFVVFFMPFNTFALQFQWARPTADCWTQACQQTAAHRQKKQTHRNNTQWNENT